MIYEIGRSSEVVFLSVPDEDFFHVAEVWDMSAMRNNIRESTMPQARQYEILRDLERIEADWEMEVSQRAMTKYHRREDISNKIFMLTVFLLLVAMAWLIHT
jgi:hypothetical protein